MRATMLLAALPALAMMVSEVLAAPAPMPFDDYDDDYKAGGYKLAKRSPQPFDDYDGHDYDHDGGAFKLAKRSPEPVAYLGEHNDMEKFDDGFQRLVKRSPAPFENRYPEKDPRALVKRDIDNSPNQGPDNMDMDGEYMEAETQRKAPLTPKEGAEKSRSEKFEIKKQKELAIDKAKQEARVANINRKAGKKITGVQRKHTQRRINIEKTGNTASDDLGDLKIGKPGKAARIMVNAARTAAGRPPVSPESRRNSVTESDDDK